MTNSKPWYLSKTIWASIVTILLSVGGMFGAPSNLVDPKSVAEIVVQLVTALAGLTAVFGRLSATDNIE